MQSETKRPYDSTKRRERAENEKRASRTKVVEAAQHLFVSRGYAATTMDDIARQAGVARQTVYQAGNSKAELMHRVIDLAVAGDDEDVLLQDRQGYADVAAESDPVRQAELIAETMAAIRERLGPVWIPFREAAAVDAKATELMAWSHRLSRETFEVAIRMIPERHLTAPYDDAADIAWAVGSLDVYLLLTGPRGWSHEKYADWLKRAFVVQLIRRD
jgi:AcrR family transcriptional regulator